jgi:hypothetical protein
MATLTRDQQLQLLGAMRHYQARYDDAYQSWGVRAEAPAYSDSIESVSDYRRNEAVRAKKLLPMSDNRAAPGDPTFAELRRVKYWPMPDDAFEVMEKHLLRAVAAAGKRNDSVPYGEMREIHERGENGEHIIKWLGQRSFVHDFKSIPRRVAYFRTDSGPVRTDGRPVQL